MAGEAGTAGGAAEGGISPTFNKVASFAWKAFKFVAFSFLLAGFLDITLWHSFLPAKEFVAAATPYVLQTYDSIGLDHFFNFLTGLIPAFPVDPTSIVTDPSQMMDVSPSP